MARWMKRIAAIIYVSTIGLVVGVILMVVGSLYGIVGTALRLINYGDKPNPDTWTRRPISGPVSDTMTWWAGLLFFAIRGRGDFQPAPGMGGGRR